MELATYHTLYLLMSILRDSIFGTSGYLCIYKGNFFFLIGEIENISIASLMKQCQTMFLLITLNCPKIT